jgi:F420H(2)-dependent quinone reductase
MRRLVVAVVAGLAVFLVVTGIALEGREVVVLETTDAGGAPRRTRTWIAEEDGSLWVEAANPERPFVADLRRAPSLVLERGRTRLACRADVVDAPDGHARIRRLLAARYGWADYWIGMLADTRRSLAVRLACA